MGKEIHQSIVIDAKIKTTLENMDKTITQLQQGLNKGITNLDMSKGIGNSLSKTMSAFKEEFGKFSDLTKSGNLELIDSKKALQSGERIVEKYREIQRIVGNFSDLKLVDAKKLFPDAFNNEIGEFQNKLQILQQNLNNLEIKGMETTAAETKLTALQTQAEELKSKLIDEKTLAVNVEQANSKLDSATQKVENIRTALKEELKLKLDTADLESGRLTKEIEKIEKARAGRGVSGLVVGAGGHVTYQGKTSKQWEKSGASKEQIAAAQQAIQVFAAEEKQLNKLREGLASSEKEATKLRAAFAGFGDKTDLVKTAQMLGKSSSDIEQTKNALDGQAQAADRAKEAQDELNNAQSKNKNTQKDIENNSKALDEQQQKVEKLRLQYSTLFEKIDVSKLEQGLQNTLGKDFTPEMLRTKEGIEQILQKLRESDQTSLEKLKASLINLGIQADVAEDYVRQLRDGLDSIGAQSASIKKASSDMQMLKSRFEYFFGITNSIQLFKRAVTSALNTVKELDKTMTEAAVVTNFSVGDMWTKLPEYSKHAQELGVSINGMYEATTLYYQQGLKTNAAMSIGVETMKMAKIAAMDSTDATKAMTAALRGFNMELNETSAIRVNDGYSQLAAGTAADTNQIATAMEKTASIAASANMEFETTAALLAQIIETTQEAPETAGTAMKTIIARFAEVKSLREQGELTGTDAEGEKIDVNKIQTALRSVGISMDGFFAGTEGLDSVLLRLAEKWDTLDFETQRYIATMAAGSRQQSRFIAMMSDYGRTAELVDKAWNSTGASQRQFEKTLESMESKLQRLKNAWDQFTMGLANNEILKGAVDILTNIIEGINKLTSSIDNGLVKSIVNLGVAIGGLMAGKSLVNMLFGGAAAKGMGKLGDMLGFSGGQGSNQAPQYVAPGQEIGFKQSLKNAGKSIGGKAKGFGGKIIAPFKNSGLKEGQISVKQFQNTKNFKSFMTKTETDLGDRMDEQAMSVRKLNEQLAEGQITTTEAAKGYEKLGYNLEEAGIKTKHLVDQEGQVVSSNQQFVQGTQSAAQALQGMSSAMFAAGAACAGLAALLSAMGYDEAAEKMTKLSGIIMGVGAIFMALGPVVSGVGKVVAAAGITAQAAWGWIGLILGAIAALITLVIAFSKKSKDLSEEISSVNKQIEQMSSAAQEAEESLDRIGETRDKLDDLKVTMNELTKGTTEWKKTLIDSNNEVLKLLDTYPILSSFITQNRDGLLVVDYQGWEALLNEQTRIAMETKAIQSVLWLQKSDLEQTQLLYDYQSGLIAKQEYDGKMANAQYSQQILLDSFYASLASPDGSVGSEYFSIAAEAQGLGLSSSQFITQVQSEAVGTSKQDEEALVKEYAKLLNLEESMVKEQLKNGEITKEEMANQIKIHRVYDKTLSQTNELAKKLSFITDKSKLDLVSRLLSSNGDDLRYKDLAGFINQDTGEINEQTIREYLIELELDEDQIAAILKNASVVADDYSVNFGQKLEEYGFEKGSNVETVIMGSEHQAASRMLGYVSDMQASGRNNQEIEELFAILNDVSTTLGEDYLALLADTNWESKNSVRDTMKVIESAEGAEEIPGLESLGDRIIDLTGAVIENTAAQLKKDEYALIDFKNRISSGELNESNLSQRDIDELIKSGKFSEADFQQIGTDRYMYIGGESLYDDIVKEISINQADQEDKISNAASNLGKSQAFSKVAGDVNKATSKAPYVTMSADQIQAEAEKYISSNRKYRSDYLSLEQLQIAGYALEQLRSNIYGPGVSYADALVLADQGGNNGIARYDWTDISGPVDYNHLKFIDTTYRNAAAAIGVTPTATTWEEQQSQMIGWETTYGDTQAFQDEYEDSVRSSATWTANVDSYTGNIHWAVFSDEEEQKDYNKDRGKSLEQRLKATGGAGYIDDIEDGLKRAGKTTEDFTDAINAMASDMAVTTTKTTTLAQNLAQLAPSFDKSSNDPEYQQALTAAKTNIAEYYGITLEQLDMANIADSFFVELAKGDATKLPEIGRQIAQSTIPNLNMSTITPLIQPRMDEEGMKQLYVALGGAEADFDENINDAVDLIATRLGWLGVKFSAQMNDKGFWEGSAFNFDPTSSYKNAYSGGGGGSSSKWKNEYDELYNIVEKINEELRQREKLELRYERLLKRNAANAKKLSENLDQRLASLQIEQSDRTTVLAERQRQMEDIMSEYSDLEKYAKYNSDLRQIEIDWNLLEGLDGSTNEKLTSRIEEYISKLEQQQDYIEEEQEALDSINNGIWEIYEQGKDEYSDLEDQIKEAIISTKQKEIDLLGEINTSIVDTNTKLLEEMQEQIDAYRQNRDNEKTEEELLDKQRKLLYLQQDTSGANATEILRLQKEIEEGQQDYTDTLIDQKISELQKQNDEAAEQRQQQIDLMQAQLDKYSESAKIWEDVNKLMNEGLDKENGLVRGSKLAELLESEAGFEGLSKIGQMNWLNELNANIASALSWLSTGAMQSLIGEGNEITFKDADGNTITGIVDSNGNVTANERIYGAKTFSTNSSGEFSSNLTDAQAKENYLATLKPPEEEKSGSGNLASLPGTMNLSAAQVKTLQKGLNELIEHGEIDAKKLTEDGIYGGVTREVVKKLQTKIGAKPVDGLWGAQTKKIFDSSALKAYKSGGLADFTGPAWLDGTKSRPEYILNADQTKAFFHLVDVLGSLSNGQSKTTEKSGDSSYDIDINVESIGSDYDVEQLANKVKSLINEDARYRNNNAVNLMR